MRDDKRRWPNAVIGPQVPIRGESCKSAFRSGVSAFVRRSRCPVNRGIADAKSAGGGGAVVGREVGGSCASGPGLLSKCAYCDPKADNSCGLSVQTVRTATICDGCLNVPLLAPTLARVRPTNCCSERTCRTPVLTQFGFLLSRMLTSLFIIF